MWSHAEGVHYFGSKSKVFNSCIDPLPHLLSVTPIKHTETQTNTLTTSCYFYITFQLGCKVFFFEDPWNVIMSWKGSRDSSYRCCCCSVSVGTRCWLWLKAEVLLLNKPAPLRHEHYPLSSQCSPASKAAHYSPSYPNFLIWERLDGGFLSSCVTTLSQNPYFNRTVFSLSNLYYVQKYLCFWSCSTSIILAQLNLSLLSSFQHRSIK